jgi:two-component system sensor histidine kinase AlgZ
MNEPEILSTLQLPESLTPSLAASATGNGQLEAAHLLVFDACHVGVVLRAVLFVEAVVGVGLMFVRPMGWPWLLDLAAITAVAQPAVLMWLLLGCALKGVLARWPVWGQAFAGVVLGAVAGVFAVALWWWLGAEGQPLWLAGASAGALLASALVAGLVWRARAQLPASTTARLAELQSRIRPHFLFNTLNSAIALVRAEPARAEALLEDLSELFRSALADSQQAVPLAQELTLAERYLAIEQVRFGPRLRVEWHTDPAAGAALLPPLLLQPLVENAVKHGVEPSISGADIRISTERRGETVVIKVVNTVPAGAGPHGMGLALANVRERLALMHDLKASFRSGEIDGQYVVRLEVPL